MFAANGIKTKVFDATGLPRGASRLQLLASTVKSSTAQGRGIQLRIRDWCSDRS